MQKSPGKFLEKSWNFLCSYGYEPCISNKASQKLGFLKRNLRIHNGKVKSLAYSSMIRSNLEYCSTVWSPHTLNDINRLESVQRRAARWVCNRYHNTSSVSEMILGLEWPTLHHRRRDGTLCMLYKIRAGLVAIDEKTYLTPVNRPTRHTNSQAYILPSCRSDGYKYSFFPRAIKAWNTLDESAVRAPTLDAFKKELESLRAPSP